MAPDSALARESTRERAVVAMLASAMGGLVGCIGGLLGVMRVLVEAYRSCPDGAAEMANATMATELGFASLAVFALAIIAVLWGLFQVWKKRALRPGLVALVLGLTSAGLGGAATLVPATTMCRAAHAYIWVAVATPTLAWQRSSALLTSKRRTGCHPPLALRAPDGE